MIKQLIKSPLLPIISLVTYIVYSYLFTSLFDFDPLDESLLFKIHFVDPLNFLSSFFSYHLLSPTLIIFLTTLLFTLQRTLTLKNIGCVIAITSLTFIITKLLFFFIIPLRLLYLADIDSSTLFIFLLMNRSMIHSLLFIICLALCYHYIFTKVNPSTNTTNLSLPTTQYIITCFYSFFVIITFISYARYSVFSPPYAVVDAFDEYLPLVVVIAFFYLYSWVNEYLKHLTQTSHYCGNIIKAYSMSIVLHILFANLLFIIIMLTKNFINQTDQAIIFFKQTYWLWSIILIGLAIFFIIIVAKQSNNLAYKITHYLLFISLSGLILFALSLLGSSFEIMLCIYAMIFSFISFITWVNAFIVKRSIDSVFYVRPPVKTTIV